MEKQIKLLAIDKDNIIGVLDGTEKNARITSFVEHVLTFVEVEFIFWNYSTSEYKFTSFRGTVKDLIKEYNLSEDTIWITELDNKSNIEEIIDYLNDVDNIGIEECENGFIIKPAKKTCKFTLLHEEDGKVLFNKTVTDPDEIISTLVEYYNKCQSKGLEEFDIFSPKTISDLTSLLGKYFK